MKKRIYANPTFWALIIVGFLILASVALTWWLPFGNAGCQAADAPKVVVSYSEVKSLPEDSATDTRKHKQAPRKGKKSKGRKKQPSGNRRPASPAGSPLDHKL